MKEKEKIAILFYGVAALIVALLAILFAVAAVLTFAFSFFFFLIPVVFSTLNWLKNRYFKTHTNRCLVCGANNRWEDSFCITCGKKLN